jgi:uncharacterized membrane protein YjgN (DUF898 family)
MIEQDTSPPSVTAHTPLALGFTGSGAEYFRIWIVNLLLTVATFGIYSAWAKTRRLQYFYRNTHLAGASFDFRGNPKAILRGRLLGVMLVAAYHYAFGFSMATGVTVISLLLLALPFLMRSALRFRLSNTWYRGLPFGFAGSVRQAYGVYLLPVAMFVLPGALVALMPGKPMVTAVFLLYLFWPLMHGAMKRYQHAHLLYGDQHAGFTLSSATLAKPYLRAFLAGLGVLLVFGIVVYAAIRMQSARPEGAGQLVAIVSGAALLYLYILLSGPFILVRMNNLAWSDTRFPGVRIACAMKARTYLRLQVVNVVLTLLTLGLYRPFAAVRTWRYRVDHVRIEAPDGFDTATGLARRRGVTAAGEGAADFLGVDLSW